jgi:hypothetical protein
MVEFCAPSYQAAEGRQEISNSKASSLSTFIDCALEKD